MGRLARRRGLLTAASLTGALLVTGCSGDTSRELRPPEIEGLTVPAQAADGRVVAHTADGPVPFPLGVNIGATVPGHAPGEVVVSGEDLARWLPMIAEAGFDLIRVYTILGPDVYEAIAEHNTAHPQDAVHVVHGVWIPGEHVYLEEQDLFDPRVREGFHEEIDRAVDVVHGDADLPERPGNASGVYTADISEWVVGWALGVELDPHAVAATDRTHAGTQAHDGDYFSSGADASPTEIWLAQAMDRLAVAEARRGRSVPVTFNNWPTTGPLDQPYEPNPDETTAKVDANHIDVHDSWPGGMFASYHAYPYYPDFQWHDPRYTGFELDGRPEPYGGYLRALADHHGDLPVVITEVGVPSSLGSAHAGPLGRDQGGHREAEAMAINAELLEVIDEVGLAGAYLFSWTDEWFKLTWNTMELEIPAERRPMWDNVWTNEQAFGLLAHDAGERPSRLVGGGDEESWEFTPAIHEGQGAIREVRATHDESFVYLRLRLEEERDGPVALGFSVLDENHGTGGGLDGVSPRADHAVVIPAEGDVAQAYTRAHRDPHAARYGPAGLDYLGDVAPAALAAGSSAWREQMLMTNRPQTVPATGERLPAEEFPIGRLRRGIADPDHRDYDSLAMWHEDDRTIELRLPHATLGFADPSSLQAVLADAEAGTIGTRTVERIGITVTHGGERVETAGYAWAPWQQVTWHERPKAGLDELTSALTDLRRARQ